MTLAEQLARLTASAAPEDFDPEDATFGEEAYRPTGKGEYAPVAKSKLRKTDKLNGPTYAGKPTSRRALQDFSDEEEEDEEDEEELDEEEMSEQEEEDTVDEEDDEENDDEIEEEEEEEEEEEDDDEDAGLAAATAHTGSSFASEVKRLQEQDVTRSMSAFAAQARSDAEKGLHVTHQMALWGRVLDLRIRSQRAFSLANRLPKAADARRAFERSDAAIGPKFNEVANEAAALVHDLCDARNLMLNSVGVKVPTHKRSASETPEELWESLQASNKAFAEFRDDTLSKWSAKASLTSAAALKGAQLKAIAQGIPQQVSLMLNDSDRLTKRLCTRRAPLSILGDLASAAADAAAAAPGASRLSTGPVVDPETLDDGDFYQQLLHELLQSQLSSEEFAEPAQMAKHWAALREYKQRSKAKVDTKASKGRKVRYDVHTKLVNFVVPQPRKGMWHEAREEELFANLLGAGRQAEEEKKQKVASKFKQSEISIF